MEEIKENDKWNGQWQERKEQMKMARTRAKRKNMDVKALMEAEDKQRKGRTQALLEKRSEKTNQHTLGEEWMTNNDKKEKKI